MAFSHYKAVTLDHTQCGPGDCARWPLAVRVTDRNLATVTNGGAARSAYGYDIRPYAEAALTTPLPFELVRYDPAVGALDMHVAIPVLSATADTVIYIAIGNPALVTDGSTPGVWDDAYAAGGVWHLDGAAQDSAGAHHGTINGATPAAGLLAGALSCDGTLGQYVELPHPEITSTTDYTWSFWLFPNTWQSFFSAVADAPGRPWTVFFNQLGNVSTAGVLFAWLTSSGEQPAVNAVNGAWTYVTFRRIGAAVAVFSNGALVYAQPFNGDAVPAVMPRYGTNPSGGAPYQGLFDEVRIAYGAGRSDAWIRADYHSQKPASTFATWGALAVAGPGARYADVRASTGAVVDLRAGGVRG